MWSLTAKSSNSTSGTVNLTLRYLRRNLPRDIASYRTSYGGNIEKKLVPLMPGFFNGWALGSCYRFWGGCFCYAYVFCMEKYFFFFIVPNLLVLSLMSGIYERFCQGMVILSNQYQESVKFSNHAGFEPACSKVGSLYLCYVGYPYSSLGLKCPSHPSVAGTATVLLLHFVSPLVISSMFLLTNGHGARQWVSSSAYCFL